MFQFSVALLCVCVCVCGRTLRRPSENLHFCAPAGSCRSKVVTHSAHSVRGTQSNTNGVLFLGLWDGAGVGGRRTRRLKVGNARGNLFNCFA